MRQVTGLTRPSSGRAKAGFASFVPPLKFNVRLVADQVVQRLVRLQEKWWVRSCGLPVLRRSAGGTGDAMHVRMLAEMKASECVRSVP